MSTIATEAGTSVVINARRTESIDAPHILELVQPWTEVIFGRVNVVNIIEKAVLAVTLTNESEQIMASAAFLDHPNIPSVNPAEWETWMQNNYKSKACNSLNSLYLHYFVAQPQYTQGCMREMVRTAFNAVPELHYIFLVIPTDVDPDSCFTSIFEPLDTIMEVENVHNWKEGLVYVCHRHKHVPVLHIRKARVEDHDDLIPIFNQHSEMLKAIYGRYFLAELIEAEDEHMQCMVAEVEGTAVGFMSISDDVNVNLLNECFELGPFHGLRKPHERDVTSPSSTPTSATRAPSSVTQTGGESGNMFEGSGAESSREESKEISQQSTQKVTSDGTQKATSDAAQKTTSDATQKTTSDVAQKTTSDATQKTTSDVAQKTTSDATQKTTSDVAQKATSDATQKATSDAAQKATSSATQKVASDAAQKATSGATQKVASDAAQKATSGATQVGSQEESQEVTQEGSEDASNELGESQYSKDSQEQSMGSRSVPGSVIMEEKLSEQAVMASGHSFTSQAIVEEDEENLTSSESNQNEEETTESSCCPKLPEVPSLDDRFIPTYHGETNAFSIQLFCIDERYEMRSCDFMTEAFGCFPQYDFCVITVPHLVPEFPLLQNFVRVTPRCPSTLPQELYVFNRCGLLKYFQVRPACTHDLMGVEMLVDTIQLKESLMQDLHQFNLARRDPDGTGIQAFVAECQKQIVGVAILRQEEDIEYIRSHYNIEDFIYFNHHRRQDHGHLHHMALNPIFSHLSKHFFKEILRLSRKTCLYYPLYPKYCSDKILERHSLVCPLGVMFPVRARRQIIYSTEQLGLNAPSERILLEREPYALSHINLKLTLEPKVTINARIVVVGASDVGLSFLETFAYCPHLRFNNMTLISPHGMPGEMPPDARRDAMLPSSHCYSQADYAKTSLRTWVNVVYGSLTFIDRKHKFVVVDKCARVPYDHLVLCMGQQFYVPAPSGLEVTDQTVTQVQSSVFHKRLTTDPPKNAYVVNDAFDAAVTLYRIDTKLSQNPLPIVIYGNNVEAYCCIQSMLSSGIPGEQIDLVKPPTEEPNIFDDETVAQTMEVALNEAGVRVHTDYYLGQWDDQMDTPDEISSVTFIDASNTQLRLECQAFFSYFKKGSDLNAFTAVNSNYLIYDGNLVVDGQFHTNDVCIRGAGPFTKFKRHYHAGKWSHACFNSKEVGIALATEMLRLFDPTLEDQPDPATASLPLIPLYRSPRILEALLPGGYHYLKVISPGIPDPAGEASLNPNFPVQTFSTGEPDQGDGYMRLGISQYNAVDKIICLSKKPFPSTNLICLYGVHERLLNNLVSRFEEGLIQNLYSFFSESWCMAVFHDRFADFRDELRELLTSSPGEEGSMEEKVRQVVDEEIKMSQNQRLMLHEMYELLGSKEAVETRLLSFLAYNYYHLPMYAKPGMV